MTFSLIYIISKLSRNLHEFLFLVMTTIVIAFYYNNHVNYMTLPHLRKLIDLLRSFDEFLNKLIAQIIKSSLRDIRDLWNNVDSQNFHAF